MKKRWGWGLQLRQLWGGKSAPEPNLPGLYRRKRGGQRTNQACLYSHRLIANSLSFNSVLFLLCHMWLYFFSVEGTFSNNNNRFHWLNTYSIHQNRAEIFKMWSEGPWRAVRSSLFPERTILQQVEWRHTCGSQLPLVKPDILGICQNTKHCHSSHWSLIFKIF